MKKKLMAAVLATAMVMSVTACGNTDANNSGNANGSEQTSGNASNAGNTSSTDSDLDYIKNKGTLVVGVTDFEPMDYQDENGNWIGFDAELAQAFGAELGVAVEIVEIDWDNKILELNAKSVDCIWNGMTLTDEVKNGMECSDAYCINAQVVVVKADVADQYNTVDSLSGLSFAVEAGSAGKEQAEANGLTFTEVESQANALMEVKAGTSDAAIIDNLMAAAMVGEGTSYSDLTYTVSLNSEEYGVGFRKGSDAAAALNDFLKASLANGETMRLAEKYGVAAMIMQ